MLELEQDQAVVAVESVLAVVLESEAVEAVEAVVPVLRLAQVRFLALAVPVRAMFLRSSESEQIDSEDTTLRVVLSSIERVRVESEAGLESPFVPCISATEDCEAESCDVSVRRSFLNAFFHHALGDFNGHALLTGFLTTFGS